MKHHFRSRKLNRNEQDVEVDCQIHFPEELEAGSCNHKGGEAYIIHLYSRYVGSQLAKISLLAFHAALFFSARVLFRNGHLSSRFLQSMPTAWTAEKWRISSSTTSRSTEMQQKMIDNDCLGRKVIAPLMAESSISQDIPWTICMTINSGFYDFFHNWYLQYEKLDLKTDVVLFAEDAVACERLSNAPFLNKDFVLVVNATNTGPPRPTWDGSSSSDDTDTALNSSTDASDDSSSSLDLGADSAANEGVFHAYSYDYKELIANRPSRLLQVVCSGRNALYIDTDTVLKKSPLPIINKNYMEGVDISIAVDGTNRSAYAHGTDFCTGFVAIKANSKAVRFLSEWETACHDRDGYALNDQVSFNKAYQASWTKWKESNTSTVNVEGLPQALFPNGDQYFNLYNESQREEVILAHANWIVGGSNKKHSFMEHGLWEPE